MSLTNTSPYMIGRDSQINMTFQQTMQQQPVFSSLDTNSTNPLGGGDSLITRSMHIPSNAYSSFPASPPRGATMEWNSPPKALHLATEVPPHTSPTTSNKSVFQSGLGACLAAQKVAGFQIGVVPSSNSLATNTLQRQDSVPSSCGSGSTLSPRSSEAGTPLMSAATSPCNSMMLASADPPVIAPCPISLWFGLEDETHARAVLAQYAQLLDVSTQRAVNSRAPLEFIGRVKRSKLDLPKLHRIVEQHLALAKAAPRQRYASAADSMLKGCDLKSKRISASSPCLSRFDEGSFLGSSPLSSSPAAKLFASPLHSLPPKDSFATLDLVSIYSRDTLPLGLVFPLIRHEWVVTEWNVQDGIPEVQRKIHTEFEELETQEEEEEEEIDAEALIVLDLYTQAIVKPSKLGLQAANLSRASSKQGSPIISPAHATLNPSSITTTTAAPSAADSQQRLWHGSSSPSTLSASASSSSVDSVASQTSTSSSSSSSIPPQQPHQANPVALVDPPTSTSYLYNLPIFSQDITGAFDTFGCKLVRPLGELGTKQKKGVKGKKGEKKHHHHHAHEQETAQLPSSLGYSGAANDCIYDCLVSIGRRVKCNTGVGSSDDVANEACCINNDMEMQALAAMQSDASNSNDAPAGDLNDDEDGGSSSDSDSSSSSSDSDEEDDDADQLNDVGEDVDGDDGGFSFGASDEEDEGITMQRTVSASQAIQPKRQTSTSSVRFGAAEEEDDGFSSDSDSHDNAASHSISSPIGSIPAGSLGDDLAAQLAALGLKTAPGKSSRTTKK